MLEVLEVLEVLEEAEPWLRQYGYPALAIAVGAQGFGKGGSLPYFLARTNPWLEGLALGVLVLAIVSVGWDRSRRRRDRGRSPDPPVQHRRLLEGSAAAAFSLVAVFAFSERSYRRRSGVGYRYTQRSMEKWSRSDCHRLGETGNVHY
jgi:hypothetical protein